MSLRLHGGPPEDKRLRQMILISAVLHLIVILWIVISTSFGPSSQPRAVAYTVELVNPASLGTNLPGGGKKGVQAAAESTKPQPPQQAAKQEKPKISPPVQKEVVKIPEQAKPVEKPPVRPVAEKIKVEEKKPEPTKAEPKPETPRIAKVEESKPEEKKPELKKEEAKPEPKKTNPEKVEAKKPEPQQAQAESQKNEPGPEKKEAKSEKDATKPEVVKPSSKAVEKSAEEKPATSGDETISSQDRERQIAAALERIKAQVQPKGNPEFTEGAGGSGPTTKGGAVGEGGGGMVRGIEFIMYTQELQRRVQESWIVAEKQPGLVASVSFKIQPDGEIQELELTQSSGDSVFDQSVVRAIRKATPFPPPPQSYAQEFATQKIFMNFGGEGRVN